MLRSKIEFDTYNPGMVDHVLDKLTKPEDDVLHTIRENCRRAGLPPIEVSAQQGKQLELLVRMNRSQCALEIGTLGGYSTVCIARGLIAGKVHTIEYDEDHLRVACENIRDSGYSEYINVYLGAALDILPTLDSCEFDFVFIDADKENNAAYLKWALQLSQPGATIVVDNVIRDGRVLDAKRPEKLEFVELLGDLINSKQLEASVIQTVGSKGWDGFVLARKI